MNLPTYFNIRFRTRMAGLDFFAETQCDNLEALTQRCTEMNLHPSAPCAPDIDLVAAEICFNLSKEEGGCHLFDDESLKLLTTVLKSLKVGAQHFYNERMGSYDKFNNRITPADLGIVFPDGTLRVVWRQDEAVMDFDTTLAMVSGALGLLLELQQMPYGRATEEEFENADYEGILNRRIEVLYQAGLWPDSDDSFDPDNAQSVASVLAAYRDRSAPAGSSA